MTKTEDLEKLKSTDHAFHSAEESGDIMIYLAMLVSAFNLDPVSAGFAKMRKNEKKYQG